MPKIVSSSIVSSSDHSKNNTTAEDTRDKLHVYYCLCSEFLLVVDANLEDMPRRRTDNAIIVSNARRTYKLSADGPEIVILSRPNGYEKQYRYFCPRCHLPIAYEMTEERKRGPYTYILDSAMTESQGNAPPNAIREVPATS